MLCGIKVGVHILPCPGTPGKWFLLYLKSSVSNAMRLTRAACSAGEEMLYVWNDFEINGAACVAVRHSTAAGAPSQVFDFGAIATSCPGFSGRWPPKLNGLAEARTEEKRRNPKVENQVTCILMVFFVIEEMSVGD